MFTKPHYPGRGSADDRHCCGWRMQRLRWLVAGTLVLFCGLLPAADDPPATPVVPALAERMQEIARALATGGATAEVRRQQQQVLEEMQRYRHEGASSSTSAAARREKANGAAGEPDSVASGVAGEAGAEPQQGPSGSRPVQRELFDAVWGHLPAGERDELLRSFNERFLPQYEQQIRAYYEALARRPESEGAAALSPDESH